MGHKFVLSTRAFDRLKMAHDASHYLLVPEAVATPETVAAVAAIFGQNRVSGQSMTFRSGGTSLSGQGLTDGLLVDTRRHFRTIEVLDGGARVRAEPGATVRQVNARLARFGRKLGPDPASEIACTIGGVIANNSSGMACGTEQNTYRTLESMVVVLPSGSIIDTGAPSADQDLREAEPELYTGLEQLRDRVRSNPASVEQIKRLFSMKNTMGYGINAFLDHTSPVDILARLMISSEGTLGFVAQATFNTVEVHPFAATGLAIFPDLASATGALPLLVEAGFATIELLDATSLRVAQTQARVPSELAALSVGSHAALLVEQAAESEPALAVRERTAEAAFAELGLTVAMTTDPTLRADLWHIRKGLYTAVAEARPAGTTALLEDIAVPVPALLATCERLIELFAEHGYQDAVIFGHAKDGNIHFMLTERWEDPNSFTRYHDFTEAMVDIVLSNGGTLKAEHGTGRMMAPFVRRQYGEELYEVMTSVKQLFDPAGILNPGVVLSDDPESYMRNLKPVPTVEEEVDRCVECGYCEPVCPSKDLTTTPRQRIVIRREMATAEAAGDSALLEELRRDYDYEGTETCAVDGMCQAACPVSINTGDLTRRLRRENANVVEQAGWNVAAKHWAGVTRVGSAALTIADGLPGPLVAGVTRAARAVLGNDMVPLYDGGLPSGGSARLPTSPVGRREAELVFFPACIGTLFGSVGGQGDPVLGEAPSGVTNAFLALCARTDTPVMIPDQIGSMCCGTPWSSKGFMGGYDAMTDTVLPALWEESDGGRLPIVCDAASCTEGLVKMQDLVQAASADERFTELRFIDAIEYVHDHLLPRLTVTASVPSVTLHHTCSSTHLGTNEMMNAIATGFAGEVVLPVDWQCCGFAGDRGLLHPELTASSTAQEAAEVRGRETSAYASTNLTCEIGMSRATGKTYRHLLELLEVATRPI